MAIQVKHKILIQNSEDTDGKKKLFWRDDDPVQEVLIDGLDKQLSGNVSILTTAIETLSLGDLTTIRGIYLEVDAECNMRINGSTDDIALKLPAGVTESPVAKFFLEATITQIRLENTSSGTLNAVYCIWGDPTA